jgi:phosphocarrier protein HPr
MLQSFDDGNGPTLQRHHGAINLESGISRSRMTTRAVTVTNPLGLHARAAARFVSAATHFASKVWVQCDSRVMDGKSIMGILLLAAARGSTLIIMAEGPDEHEAVEALARLVESGFGEVWSD